MIGEYDTMLASLTSERKYFQAGDKVRSVGMMYSYGMVGTVTEVDDHDHTALFMYPDAYDGHLRRMWIDATIGKHAVLLDEE